MTLQDWMRDNRKRISDVAKLLKVKPDTVASWLSARRTPQEAHLHAIWRMTNGQVRDPWPSPASVAAREIRS